jgi:hypothetical protein
MKSERESTYIDGICIVTGTLFAILDAFLTLLMGIACSGEGMALNSVMKRVSAFLAKTIVNSKSIDTVLLVIIGTTRLSQPLSLVPVVL